MKSTRRITTDGKRFRLEKKIDGGWYLTSSFDTLQQAVNMKRALELDEESVWSELGDEEIKQLLSKDTEKS